MMSHKIVFMGTPQFAVAPLMALTDNGYNVCCVVTAPDKPTGRGLKLSESEVKKYASLKGIPVLQPESLKDETFINSLKSYNADIFVVVAFRMLPEIVWSIPVLGTFNLHASLLPQYRGAAPINRAIMNGETISGVTTFMIDDKIDTGEILFRSECPLLPDESAGDLHDKLSLMGADLVIKTVRAIISGNVVRTPQNTLIREGELLNEAPKLTKETGKIDWSDESSKIYNLIRGLSPYPAAFSVLTREDKSIPVKIYSAINDPEDSLLPASELTDSQPGDILSDNKSFLKVKCKSGYIGITSIQASGKKRLGIKEFLAGTRDICSYKFE